MTELLDLLDELHIKTRLNPQQREKAIVTFRRAKRVEVDEEEKLLQRPPIRFPESLCTADWLDNSCTAVKGEVKLSNRTYDIPSLISKLQDLLR